MPGTIGGELSFNPFMRTAVPAVQAYCDHPGDAVSVSGGGGGGTGVS